MLGNGPRVLVLVVGVVVVVVRMLVLVMVLVASRRLVSSAVTSADCLAAIVSTEAATANAAIVFNASAAFGGCHCTGTAAAAVVVAG